MFCATSRVFGSTGSPASASGAGAAATEALAAQAAPRLPGTQAVVGTMKETEPRGGETLSLEKLKRGGACGWQAGSVGRIRRATGRAMATRSSGRREMREARARWDLSATRKYPKSHPKHVYGENVDGRRPSQVLAWDSHPYNEGLPFPCSRALQ